MGEGGKRLMNRRPFLFGFFGAIAGILCAVFVPYGFYIYCFVTLAVIIAAALLRKRLRLLCFALLAGCLCAGLAIGSFNSYMGASATESGFLPVAARSVYSCKGYTEALEGCSVSGTVSSVGNERVTIKNAEVIGENTLIRSTTVEVYGECVKDAAVGEMAQLYGYAVPYGKIADNPGDGNTFLSAVAENTSYVLYPESYEAVGYENSVAVFLYKIKSAIYGKLNTYFPDTETANVTYAMVTGDKAYISSDTKELFASSGVSHLLAVSGLHTTILLSVVCFFFTEKRSALRLCAVSVFLIFYTVLTGLSPSVIRAAIMAFLITSAPLSGARYDLANSLGLAGLLSLVFNPFRLFSLSFQLSFCAVFGICAFSFDWLSFPVSIDLFNKAHFDKTIRLPQTIRTTLGATLGTLPVTAWCFGAMPLAAVPANMLLIPVATTGLSLTVVCLLISFILPFAGVCLRLPYCLMRAVLLITDFFGEAPVVTTVIPRGYTVLIGIAALIYFSKFFLRSNKIKVAAVMTVAVVLCGIGYSVKAENTLSVNVLCDTSTAVHLSLNNEHFLICKSSDTVIDGYAEAVIPSVSGRIILGSECRLYSENMSMPFSDKFYFGEAVISPEDGGILITYNGKTVFIQTEEEFPENRSFDVVVSDYGNACGKNVIAYDTPSEQCAAQYMTSLEGCVTAEIGKNIRIKTFH